MSEGDGPIRVVEVRAIPINVDRERTSIMSVRPEISDREVFPEPPRRG